MKIRYFEDTDTAVIELGSAPSAEIREITENLLVDLDASGSVVGITIEHASRGDDLSEFSFQRIAAPGPDIAAQR
jgi:uncharacterized protein YuzE